MGRRSKMNEWAHDQVGKYTVLPMKLENGV